MNPDYLRLVHDAEESAAEAVSATANLQTGGGSGTFDPMEARVKALEDKFEKIDSKLGSIATDVAYMKGKLEGAATKAEVATLDGKVNTLDATIRGLPSTSKLAGLLAIAVAALTLIGKWPEVMAALHQ